MEPIFIEGHELSIELIMRLLQNHEAFSEIDGNRLKQKSSMNPTMSEEIKTAIRDLDKELVG